MAPASFPWIVTLNSTLLLVVPRFTEREAKGSVGSKAFLGWVFPTGVGVSQVSQLVNKKQGIHTLGCEPRRAGSFTLGCPLHLRLHAQHSRHQAIQAVLREGQPPWTMLVMPLTSEFSAFWEQPQGLGVFSTWNQKLRKVK